MKNRASLRLPNDIEFAKPLLAFFDELCSIVDFPAKERGELKEALFELFENAVVHAYGNEEGQIEVVFELFDNGIKIDVHDWGIPIDPAVIKAVPIDLQERDKGLNRVYRLVDELRFFNLGLDGKKFSILKTIPMHLRLKEDIPYYSDIGEDLDVSAKEMLRDRLVVRTYRSGDEVWIPKLIYKNYGYTYFKDTFYYPEKIAQKERSGEILSVVAEVDEKIVGHFALVRVPDSNIAEIGIAVVDPAFKGMGIMKEMFKLLLQKAQELGLDALFGEAITFHPYSQRANARFGFATTALLLGEVHQMVRLKGHKYPFRQRRGAVALEYKIFNKRHKTITLPARYEEIARKSYELCQVPYILTKRRAFDDANELTLEHNPTFAISTIVIERAGESFEEEFKRFFDRAIAKHPDMIYADINIETIGPIEDVVQTLRAYGFFYAGIVFLRRRGCDYLRLQFEASEYIEEENIVCYSDYCKELHRFILADKEDVYNNL